MRLKIRGGTVEHGQPSLCLTCRSATIVKGPSLRDEIVECSLLRGPIGFPVTSCNSYINSTHPTIREMERREQPSVRPRRIETRLTTGNLFILTLCVSGHEKARGKREYLPVSIT